MADDDQSQTTEQLQPEAAEATAADPVAEEVAGDPPVVEEVTEVAAVDPASPATEEPVADDAA